MDRTFPADNELHEPPGVPDWERLLDACRAAVELSRQVHAFLVSGSAPAALIPLLQREAALAAEVQRRITDLNGSPSPGVHAAHADLVAQMDTLLQLESENYQLLRTRGMKLTGPGSRAHRARRSSRTAGHP